MQLQVGIQRQTRIACAGGWGKQGSGQFKSLKWESRVPNVRTNEEKPGKNYETLTTYFWILNHLKISTISTLFNLHGKLIITSRWETLDMTFQISEKSASRLVTASNSCITPLCDCFNSPEKTADLKHEKRCKFQNGHESEWIRHDPIELGWHDVTRSGTIQFCEHDRWERQNGWRKQNLCNGTASGPGQV